MWDGWLQDISLGVALGSATQISMFVVIRLFIYQLLFRQNTN